MASAATINQWLDELAGSILYAKPNITKAQTRKLIDGFRRRVRHHNFARTNQFDVQDRLNGLEEKFQVLNRDDLSDELYEQRLELRNHEERWLPDILDLLLRLSDRPIDQTNAVSLQDHDPKTSTSPLLRWADLGDDEPFRTDNPLWRIPSFSDLSSDADEVDTSTTATSPASAKQRPKHGTQNLANTKAQIFEESLPVTDLSAFGFELTPVKTDSTIALTEIQMIRQALLMLQGYPTNVFVRLEHRFILKPEVDLHGLPYNVVQQLLQRLFLVRGRIDAIQNWIQEKTTTDYVQLIKQELSNAISSYLTWIATFTNRLLHPNSTTAVSLLGTIDLAEENAQDVTVFAEFVQSVRDADPVTCLDHLYNLTSRLYFSEHGNNNNKILQIFVKAFKNFTKPVQVWVENGNIGSDTQSFFVRKRSPEMPTSLMWHEWYELSLDGAGRPPKFLAACSQDIFACGKTAAFLRLLGHDSSGLYSRSIGFDAVLDEIQRTALNPIVPFPITFTQILNNYFSSMLREKTKVLKNILDTGCDLDRSLNTFDLIYLRANGMMVDNFETKIFSKIDRCVDSWNDRFLVADMLEEGFGGVYDVDIQSITVHSVHTSSRSMESRRRSVRILSALAIDYVLPWPVANIIPKASMGSYRRTALHLIQIRRAKYVLERIAYEQLQQTPISENQYDHKYVQIVTFILLQFVNTLYDHFTTVVIAPSTKKMRNDLHGAQSMDEMITVHRTYITKLESSCLITKNVKMLKETLIGLLDMCIRFVDLVSSTTTSLRRNSDDIEASSFISAESQRRRRRRHHRHRRSATALDENVEGSSSSDDDDEDGNNTDVADLDGHEGYSSFIVLDEDTTIAQEVRKLLVQFRRQLDFFVAGLRAVGRGGGGGSDGSSSSSGEAVDEFETLATRLEWKR